MLRTVKKRCRITLDILACRDHIRGQPHPAFPTYYNSLLLCFTPSVNHAGMNQVTMAFYSIVQGIIICNTAGIIRKEGYSATAIYSQSPVHLAGVLSEGITGQPFGGHSAGYNTNTMLAINKKALRFPGRLIVIKSAATYSPTFTQYHRR